jgi:hypothetical protein
MYELYYGTGGHGGPYPTLEDAVQTAERLLAGNKNEQTIRVVNRHTNRTERVVKKGEQTSEGHQLARAIVPMLHRYPGSNRSLLAAVEEMPAPALRELLNLLRHAEDETASAKRRLMRGF